MDKEIFEQLCAIMSESVELIESIFKDIEEAMVDTPDDIATLKKQIKYCKNPMEMKMLNKRLNDAYKKSKRRKKMNVNILHSTDVENVVDNPQHYKHGTFEVIDEMIMVFGPARTYEFCIMNAWKYRSRAPYKDNMEQDMDKADRYLQMAYQILENNPELGHIGLIKEE